MSKIRSLSYHCNISCQCREMRGRPRLIPSLLKELSIILLQFVLSNFFLSNLASMFSYFITHACIVYFSSINILLKNFSKIGCVSMAEKNEFLAELLLSTTDGRRPQVPRQTVPDEWRCNSKNPSAEQSSCSGNEHITTPSRAT